MDELKNVESGKVYRHYKGNEYVVLCTAINSETLEQMVVYRALYDKMTVWVRPLSMFVEKVEVDGKVIDRFSKREDQY